MNSFLAHVGDGNSINLDYTLGQRRSLSDIIRKLPAGPEREYFDSHELRHAFPDGAFNVWGVPRGAKEPFDRTKPGDVVFFAPSVSKDGGCVLYFGVVKLISRLEFPKASRVLWMDSGDQIFPHLFFFDAEMGMISWFEFMRDICYSPDWNPTGWYVRLARASFRGSYDALSYLSHLRANHGFKRKG